MPALGRNPAGPPGSVGRLRVIREEIRSDKRDRGLISCVSGWDSRNLQNLGNLGF